MNLPFDRPPEVPPEIAFVSLPVALAQFHHLPRHVPVWLHRQEAVEKDGYDFTEGARAMEELLKEAPGVPGAYLYQLFVRKWPLLLAVNPLLASGRVAEAIPKLVEVLEVDPECPLTCFQLGFCFRATGELERSASFYRQALRMAPEAGWVHSNLGRTCQALGDPAQAARSYWRALELLPSDAFVLEQLMALGELFLIPPAKEGAGPSYVKKADYEKKAGEILEKETDPKTLNQVGWKLLQDRLTGTASRFFEKALASKGAPAEAKLGQGRVLLDQGRFAEAERLILEFLEEEPSSAPGHLALFKAYLAQEETDLAWEEIQTAARSDPGRADTLAALYLYFREAGRLEEGAEWFEGLCDEFPDCAPALAMRAKALLELDRWKEARGAFEEALKAAPGHEEILLAFSSELGKRGETAALLDLLSPIRETLPFSLTINLALAFDRKGEKKKAREVLEGYLERPGISETEKQRAGVLLEQWGKEE